MATAGSGDVLSGILAGLLAYLNFSLLTISLGVLINGIAGCLAEKNNTDISMLASDTINKIGIKYFGPFVLATKMKLTKCIVIW